MAYFLTVFALVSTCFADVVPLDKECHGDACGDYTAAQLSGIDSDISVQLLQRKASEGKDDDEDADIDMDDDVATELGDNVEDDAAALAREASGESMQRESSGDKKKNVLGGNLQTCSKPGMAMTGFTRDGNCVDQGNDDEGSHHICVNMKADFCEVTGQPNWCVEKTDCMGEDGQQNDEQCPIKNWCVCQWAFAEYLAVMKVKEGRSCSQALDLQCDAVNMAALKAYEEKADEDGIIAYALDCLKEKCNL